MAKTKFEVVTIFDGDLDVTEAFISMIIDKIHITKRQDILSKKQQLCYAKDEVPVFNNLASGLCG